MALLFFGKKSKLIKVMTVLRQKSSFVFVLSILFCALAASVRAQVETDSTLFLVERWLTRTSRTHREEKKVLHKWEFNAGKQLLKSIGYSRGGPNAVDSIVYSYGDRGELTEAVHYGSGAQGGLVEQRRDTYIYGRDRRLFMSYVLTPYGQSVTINCRGGDSSESEMTIWNEEKVFLEASNGSRRESIEVYDIDCVNNVLIHDTTESKCSDNISGDALGLLSKDINDIYYVIGTACGGDNYHLVATYEGDREVRTYLPNYLTIATAFQRYGCPPDTFVDSIRLLFNNGILVEDRYYLDTVNVGRRFEYNGGMIEKVYVETKYEDGSIVEYVEGFDYEFK